MKKFYCTVYHNSLGLIGILEVYATNNDNAQTLFNCMIKLDDLWLGLPTETLDI